MRLFWCLLDSIYVAIPSRWLHLLYLPQTALSAAARKVYLFRAMKVLFCHPRYNIV
jgi:hypothetical protein